MIMALATLMPPEHVIIEMTDKVGRVHKIPVGGLSFFEWQDCALQEVMPTHQQFTATHDSEGQPLNRVVIDGKITDKPVFDEAGYSQALTDNNNAVMLHRIVLALKKGGGFPELETLSPEKQIEAVRSIDASLLRGLADAIAQMTEPAEGKIDKTNTFPVREAGNGSAESNGQIAGVVAEPE